MLKNAKSEDKFVTIYGRDKSNSKVLKTIKTFTPGELKLAKEIIDNQNLNKLLHMNERGQLAQIIKNTNTYK